MRDNRILISLIEEIIRESQGLESPGLQVSRDADLIATVDKYGIDRIDVPGRSAPLGSVDPLFIKSRKGDVERLMIPSLPLFMEEQRRRDRMKRSKDRSERDAISRTLKYEADEFEQIKAANDLIEKLGVREGADLLFGKFNNKPIESYIAFDNIFNVVGPDRSVPPAFLKAFSLHESTLGLKPTAGYSPLFSISPAVIELLQAKLNSYKPTYQDIITKPSVETKVAATLITRGIGIIKGGAEDLDTVLRKYRGINHEPKYAEKLDKLRIMIEVVQP
jgi:hypothetical protein